MEAQLIIQFTGKSIDDYDKLIEIETALEENLGNDADIDGHDFGSNEMNIFIFTATPEKTFSGAKEIVSGFGILDDMKAAYRDLDDEDEVFVVLWPEGSKPFSVS